MCILGALRKRFIFSIFNRKYIYLLYFNFDFSKIINLEGEMIEGMTIVVFFFSLLTQFRLSKKEAAEKILQLHVARRQQEEEKR